MKTAYLEPSAVNWIVDNVTNPSSVRDVLASAGYRPVVGLHVIYELARTFLVQNQEARGRALFSFIRDLDPSVSPGSSNLMMQEITKLRTDAAVLPFLDHVNQVATRAEITRLAAGVFDSVARTFIQTREQDIEKNHPVSMGDYIAGVEDLRSEDTRAVPNFGTFDRAVSFFQPKVPSLIRDMLQSVVSVEEATALAARLNDLPAIRSGVRANLYLMWICISQRVVPAVDKLDDYRHIIEASYCDALVSGDDQLIRTTPKINPALESLRTPELLAGSFVSAG